MAQAANVFDYALQLASAGSAAVLALAIGTTEVAAARIGFYSDITGAAEKVGMIVGGQTGPVYTRSGTDVNVAHSGAMSITKQITSTLATGTAPLVITSTTLVGNLYVARAALADTVTTNANLTGVITSVGNATSIASQTGTGTKFVVDTSPTLVTPVIGAATGTSLSVSGALTSGALTSGRITTAGASGILQDFAGFVVIGTPSATAPNTGTNAPGSLSGVCVAGADGVSQIFSVVTFGNGVAKTGGHFSYGCQGTAALPGATILNDIATFSLRGYDGTNFTSDQAGIRCAATGTWSSTSRPTQIRFFTTASTSANAVVAGIIDQNSVLSWAVGGVNGSIAYTATGLSPSIQTLGLSQGQASIGQSAWLANANAASHLFAKSRSTTIHTPGIVTAGDTLGTIGFEADDGVDFNRAVDFIVTVTGTVGSNRTPGNLVIRTGTDALTSVMTAALTIDNAQAVTFNTGLFTTSNTTEASAIGTASVVHVGGVSIAKKTYHGDDLVFSSAADFVIDGAGSGSKIGTATTQKIGFWNATPVVQPTATTTAPTAVVTTGSALASYGYTQAQADDIVTQLNRNTARLNDLATKLQTIGITA